MPHIRYFGSPLRHSDADEVMHSFAMLPPQDVQVGDHAFHQIPFVTPVSGGKRLNAGGGWCVADGSLSERVHQLRRSLCCSAAMVEPVEPRG